MDSPPENAPQDEDEKELQEKAKRIVESIDRYINSVDPDPNNWSWQAQVLLAIPVLGLLMAIKVLIAYLFGYFD